MIDNLAQIKTLLTFQSEDEFYFIQIIKRKKENPEMGSNNVTIATYYIDSLKKLDQLNSEILMLCEHHNARAYINLNVRSYKKIGFQLIGEIGKHLMNEEYKSIRNLYNSVVGSSGSLRDKTWIVDIDAPDMKNILFIKELIESLKPDGEKLVTEIPTKNGCHLITKPFDLREFMNEYPGIEVHKNNPTILYIP
jgi:hypothetical protein